MRRNGFTLLELSVVLVIIGLIIGGITVGQSMIHSSSVSAAIKEISQVATSIQTYRLKYNAIPGDHNNAFAYWGTDCAVDADTCNGNRNGKIDWLEESPIFWRHLELAELVELPYISDILRESKLGGTASYFAAFEGNYFLGHDNGLVMFDQTGATGSYREAAVSAFDAWGIDRKSDDGLAQSGKTISENGHDSPTNTEQNCLTGIEYNQSLVEEHGCLMFFAF